MKISYDSVCQCKGISQVIHCTRAVFIYEKDYTLPILSSDDCIFPDYAVAAAQDGWRRNEQLLLLSPKEYHLEVLYFSSPYRSHKNDIEGHVGLITLATCE